MRAVIQRVEHASVTIDGQVKSAINQGFLILLGICEEDTEEDVEWLVKKISMLRVFDDENGVMNCDIHSIDGEILVISQFTLFASYKKGNRPSWFRAARHEISVPLYEKFCIKLSEALGKKDLSWCDDRMNEILEKNAPKQIIIKKKSFFKRLFGSK